MALWKEMSEQGEGVPQEESPVVTPIHHRRENVSGNRHESVFGAGVTIEGKIEGDGNIRMAGKFKGDIHIKGDLNLEKGAHLTAKVHADTITIEGELEGNVVANSHVKLMETGQIIGDIKAKTLTVAPGSRMRGNVEFGWKDGEVAKSTSVRSSSDSGKNSSGV
jgi:cytoskeletal protein CcmA (bactofilin family)